MPAFSPRLLAPSLLLAWACALPGGEAPAPAASASAAAPAIDTTAISAEMLLKLLPSSPLLAVRDERVVWSDGKGGEVRFAPIDPGLGNPLLDTRIGALAIDRTLVAEGRADAIAELPRLVDVAAAAGIAADGLTVREGVLTGLHLRSPDLLVLPEGVLRLAAAPAVDMAARREAVAQAADGLIAGLGETRLEALGREALADLLRRLPGQDQPGGDGDEVQPSFARRLVRHGYLERILPGMAAAAALRDAVGAAEALEPTTLYAGEGLRLAELKDAFGRGGWLLATPTRTAYAVPHPAPLYAWSGRPLLLVAELAPGADPLHARSAPRAARLVSADDARVVARWSASGGLAADLDTWRSVMPAGKQKGVDPDAVGGFMPPHLVVAQLDGDIAGLLVPRGFLPAPADGGDSAEVERFLGDASRLLRGDETGSIPDGAYLDLIGQYLAAYVYDSPDPRLPTLIGNKRNKGDIHQTAAQTVATAAGGVMSGDCDDVAELYQTVAERQGRTAIVIQLPAHAACAWAERQRDERWHVYVLQTGPALEFSDPLLPEALRKAYRSFDPRQPVDPNSLGLLLRFSGENTRGSWRLSWRIFAEPDYCRTMIDVQRDWQYQTYQRGIQTMLRLVASGDADTANYRELAGLYTFTGQYALAADNLREALKRTREADSRFLLEIELLGCLFDGGREAEARTLAEELIATRIPEVREAMQGALSEAGIDLAGVLARKGSADLAVRALEATVLDDAVKQIQMMCAFIASPRFDESRWDLNPQWLSLRHLAMSFAVVSTRIMRQAGPDALLGSIALQRIARAVQDWQTSIAFHDVDEPGEAPARYAWIADWYRAVLGGERFDAMVAQAPAPAAGGIEHARRVGGLAQLPLDLPWIRVSVPYWFARLAELLDKDAPRPEPGQVVALAAAVEKAHAAGAALGLEHASLDADLHFARLIAALAGRDEQGLRERLRWVKDRNDKRLRDDTAQWIGDAARLLPVEWFTRVMQVWQEELDYKPKWFWIAWRAAIGGATQQALIAAKMAADRYADDPSFAEEYRFMRGLLEPVRGAATAAAVR